MDACMIKARRKEKKGRGGGRGRLSIDYLPVGKGVEIVVVVLEGSLDP